MPVKNLISTRFPRPLILLRTAIGKNGIHLQIDTCQALLCHWSALANAQETDVSDTGKPETVFLSRRHLWAGLHSGRSTRSLERVAPDRIRVPDRTGYAAQTLPRSGTRMLESGWTRHAVAALRGGIRIRDMGFGHADLFIAAPVLKAANSKRSVNSPL